jgi:phosphonate transport system substrate-binding protein
VKETIATFDLRQRHGPVSSKSLRCGTYLAPHLFWLYEFVVQFLSDGLGCRVELVQANDYERLGSELDVAFVCSLPYVLWGRAVQPLAAPVLAGARYGGQPVYFSDVVVHRDSAIRTFADLRGRSWAYNEPHSQSGYGITRFHLARLGETDGFFGHLVKAGYHECALRLVATGRVDAAAIDSHVLDTYLREHPDLATQVRIIDSLGPSPIQPTVAARRLPEAVKTAVRHILLTLSEDREAQAMLARAGVERFVPIDDAAYHPIRHMLAVAEAANFLVLR